MRVFALILAALAAGYLIGGTELAAVGGSLFYLFSGLMLGLTAVLLWRRSRWGLWSFAILLGATYVWAFAEAGPDLWALLPRVSLLTALGLWLLIPRARRSLRSGPGLPGAALVPPLALAALVILLAVLIVRQQPALATASATPAAAIPAPPADGDWRSYGGVPGGTRFSRLDQIRPDNVADLRVAWTYQLRGNNPQGLEVTPLKIDDTVYVCTGENVVIALDAESGAERWHYDAKPSHLGPCRGVTYYRVPAASGDCAERIFTNTFDARLIALDAHTGRPCAGFGTAGVVSLADGMRPVGPGQYMATSAPTLARGRLIIGGTPIAVKGFDEPTGAIRAFDAVTGKLSWAYDAGHPDRAGAPPAGAFYTVGMPNAWAAMSYDDALGLVYIPTATGGASYYGAQRRPVDDEISTAVMALDVETGRRRWIAQMVHHDLWDYDIPSQPVLADLQMANRTVKALIQPTKMGETFVLDRATGVPIDPMVERPIAQTGAVPEERLSATQPHPSQMPSLAGPLLSERRMWGLTPFDQMWCRIKFRQLRYEGEMTPPGLTPSLQSPGWLGGMDWGGASVDTDRGLMVAVTNYVANIIVMKRVDQALPHAGAKAGLSDLASYALQADVPYSNSTLPFLSPIGVPCQQPPWSRLSALDLIHHRILWSRPLGTGKDNGPFGIASRLPLPIGVPALGGSLVTSGGLTFVAASTDRTFRAFETATGRLLWQAPLPASGISTPMTYRTPQGRQIILVPAGGHKILGGPRSDSFVAFALPARGSS